MIDCLLTTDDLNPYDFSLFSYFDKLKKEFPQLKVLAFFTPYWKRGELMMPVFSNMIIATDLIPKKFIDFLLERRDWLLLGSHGLFHIRPEYSLDIHFQEYAFAVSRLIRNYLCEMGIQFQPACKPPFYKFNEIGFELPKHFGFDQMYIQDGIIDFSENKFIPRAEINLIDSHVSSGCPMPDRIDKFYPKLRLILKGKIKDQKEFHYG